MENYHRRPKTSRSKFEDDNDSLPNSQGATTTTPSIAGSAASSGSVSGSKAAADSTTKESTNKPTANHPYNRPKKHGVMVISPHGKIRTYVSRGLEILMDTNQDPATKDPSSSTSSSSSTIPSSSTTNNTSTKGVLTIKAQGRSIAKAVSIAEILKRRLEGALHQFTEIGQVAEKEYWDPNPDRPNLDPIVLTRHRPTIRIRLSKELPSVDQALTQGEVTPSVAAAVRQANQAAEAEEKAEERMQEDGESEEEQEDAWPGAVLDRDAAVRRFVGYQAPTGNDIYL